MEKDILIKKIEELLANKETNENDIQTFLENHTELIATPFLLNHGLHFNAIISKFKISDGLISDYAYLTKSSDTWYFVLVELEDAKKNLFTQNAENIRFSSQFNNAYDQILSWKAYVEENRDEVLKKIKPLKTPIIDTPVKFKYVLVISQNTEKTNSKKKTCMFAQKNSDEIRVMTYDSIISSYKNSNSSNDTKMIVSPWREGYKIKYIPSKLNTSIFAYLKPEYLKMETEIKSALIKQGYNIKAWEEGELLRFNDKNPFNDISCILKRK